MNNAHARVSLVVFGEMAGVRQLFPLAPRVSPRLHLYTTLTCVADGVRLLGGKQANITLTHISLH